MNWIWLAIPALLALTLKIGVFSYARRVPRHDGVTTLYLLFLFCLAVQNIAEIAHFRGLALGWIPHNEVNLYYVATLLAMPFFLRLALLVSTGRLTPATRHLTLAAFALAGVTGVLILATDWVIVGYRSIGYSITRIPGPLYSLVEFVIAGTVLSSFGLFLWGALSNKRNSPRARAMNRLMAWAFLPIVLVGVIVFVLLRAGIDMNAALVGPIASSIFVLVTAYATHAHQYFDIPFVMPERQAPHIRPSYLEKVFQLRSIPLALQELSSTLGVGIALVGYQNTIACGVHDKNKLAKLPVSLQGSSSTIIRHELADSALKQAMTDAGVAYAAPFQPPDANSPLGWIVLDESTYEKFYTRSDTKFIHRLFFGLNKNYFMNLLSLRSGLQYADEKIETLRTHINQLREKLEADRQDGDLMSKLKRLVPEADTLLQLKNTVDSSIYNSAWRESNENIEQAATLLGTTPVEFAQRMQALEGTPFEEENGYGRVLQILRALELSEELPISLKQVRDRVDDILIRTAVKQSGSLSGAARLLDLRKNTLWYRMRALGLGELIH